MVENEMNIFLLIQLLRKLKAGMAVLFKDNKDLIQKAENLYLKSSTIYINEDD